MKKTDNDIIVAAITELADENGMSAAEYVRSLQDRQAESDKIPEGLPEEIAEELVNARSEKKRRREEERKANADKEAAEDVKAFRELFPDVISEDIPDEVWDDVAQGIPLRYAYALRLAIDGRDEKLAAGVNRRNSEKGAFAFSDGSVEPTFTKEQVEKMSGGEVRRNYKSIIKAMKNWRLN